MVDVHSVITTYTQWKSVIKAALLINEQINFSQLHHVYLNLSMKTTVLSYGLTKIFRISVFQDHGAHHNLLTSVSHKSLFVS
jgi:hypothetical protein